MGSYRLRLGEAAEQPLVTLLELVGPLENLLFLSEVGVRPGTIDPVEAVPELSSMLPRWACRAARLWFSICSFGFSHGKPNSAALFAP